MVWITMSLALHAGSKKRKKSDSKPHSQINKCLNEKRRREQENIHLEELAELVSASPSDMTSNPHKQDKCAILKETVNQIRSQKQSKTELCDDLQQSEVSSSKPNIINNQIFGSILLEALEGFLFVVTIEGKVEFVSENIISFLKYKQDDVLDKNIFDFIHPDDRPRFHSNLLLMMPVGNGHSGVWNSENFSSGKPTKHFNCRFLVAQEKKEETQVKMENQQSVSIPQYENLSITANYIPLSTDTGETKNGITCIARRVAVEEKRVGVNKVEQFTTRIDREGKVVDLDISVLSPGSGQYLKKELLGSPVLDFCHPSDLPAFKQHLKETLETGHSTCNQYKFRLSRDKYAKVKTKSKRFQLQSAIGDMIISTHSIIRDSENVSASESQRSVSSPSSIASTSSGPGSVSDSSTVNGSIALSPLAMPNSYGSYSVSTPQNNTEFGIGDLVLDIFPNSNWPMDQNSSLKENELHTASNFVPSPQAAPASNRSSETSATASPTNSAFVSGLASSRSGSSVPSPAMQSRTPTPFGGSCYSPSTSQSSSGRSSPPRALPAKADSLNCSSTETLGINSLSQGIRQERQFDLKSNQKLRNLLTQNVDDSNSRHPVRQASQEEVTVIGESRSFEELPSLSLVNVREATSASRPKNVILRDLLNQEDDEEAPVEPIYSRSDICPVPNPLINVGACKGTETSAQQRLGNNNMLRKLLNNDDGDRNYRKSQDIIHQLLAENSGSKGSPFQTDKINIMNQRILENSVPNAVSVESSRRTPDVTFIPEPSLTKRKLPEKDLPSTSVKRSNAEGSHAQLAGQNPMLASMLAQTPKTISTNVPTSVVSTIMTQLPQERLPKNLEKKLVHTPYTTASASGPTTSSHSFQNLLAAQNHQKDIVTSDSRGHVMQSSFYSVENPKSDFIHQMISEGDNILSSQIDHNLSVANISVQNQNFLQQVAQNTNQIVTAASNVNLLSDVALIDADTSNPVQIGQASDPVFAEILEQIYSLQEEHNVEAGKIDQSTILKLLNGESIIESPQINIGNQILPSPSVPVSSSTTQDINEKIAISAIQKELMEGAALAVSTRPGAGLIATYSQAGRSGTQVSGTPIVHSSLTQEQILLLQQQQQQQQQQLGTLPPNYSLITNRIKLPNSSQTQIISNSELLAQAQRRGIQLVRNTYVNLGNNPQLRKSIKQKAYLQQQQKRLLEQQQKQQLTMQTQQPLDLLNSSGTNSFPENMNDLLNNTVAPNVTLLRSSDISEVSGSARFNITSSNPVPSPTNQTSPQLSPSQRVNPRSPFSPLSQQVFPSQTPPPTTYQAAGLSPHPPPPIYSQGGPSQSPLPMPPTTSPHLVLSPQPGAAASPQWNQRLTTSPIQNLQLQNPMLNAQLSQSSVLSNQQIRLTAQQRQQLALRSMSNSSAIQVSRSSSLTSQSDNNYPPLSPIMILQSQASQRMQRTISIADRLAVSQSQPSLSSESVLSPQSLSSPTFAAATVAVSSVSSIPSPAAPLTFSVAQSNPTHFTFEGQNVQVFSSSGNEMNLRSPAAVQSVSDLSRQELRSIVGAQNQVSISTASHVLQSLPSGSTTRLLNLQNLSRETLEELGLTMNLLSGTDAQTSSQALHSQALINVSNVLDNSSQPVVSSPRIQVEEPRPTDQKKSLLQQLLSEPT